MSLPIRSLLIVVLLLPLACERPAGAADTDPGGASDTPRFGAQPVPAWIRDGQDPPEIEAADWLALDGPETLAELRGQVVLVEFWATWCPPCRKAIPKLNNLYARYHDRGFTIRALTNENARTVQGFQERTPMDYPVGIGSRSAFEYGVTGIPHAFLVGKDGRLLWQGHDTSKLASRIEGALDS